MLLNMARVLVVEDHAGSLEAISLLLQRTGYEVNTATNGREALAMIIDKTPDVLLLDLELPEMSGVKLLQAVRSYHRLASIPAVILTGLTEGRLFEDAQSLKPSSLLLKGVATFDEIREAVRKAVTEYLSDGRMHVPEKWRGDSISPL
jgi:CheY-like chemotaxis protein